MKLTRILLIFLSLATTGPQVSAHDNDNRPLAFPTAEGYGKYTIGGRGGRVFEVTTLVDSGPGSLREAVEAEGPRTVVFRVSGTITLAKKLIVSNPYLTIAGQTAPGDGICLRGYPLNINADQVIVRYIRVRMGDETGIEDDAVTARNHKHIILDHISASWSVDETMSVYHCDSLTVQWCLVSESLFASNHAKGAHGFGGIWGSNNGSYHHNLIACHSSRNPRFAGGSGYVDFRNNVIYNWGYNSIYGGGALHKNGADPNFPYRHTDVNMVNNYFKPGPATVTGEVHHRITNPSWSNGDCGHWFIDGNVMVGSDSVTADNWLGVHPNSKLPEVMDSIRRREPWPAMPIGQQSAADAYTLVLANAGATLPRRDVVDERVVADATSGTATFEGAGYKKKHNMADKSVKSGIIDTQSEVGGWPELKSAPAPADSDHDGMPDAWEREHGLNPNLASDGAQLSSDGMYTNLEVYLATLAK